MNFNGRSAAELTELALRTALFGERNPLADQHMSFFAEMPDPLEALRAERVPDEIARPLAELLIVDALVDAPFLGLFSRVCRGLKSILQFSKSMSADDGAGKCNTRRLG